MFLDRRPSVSSQPRNGLHAPWLFWGCKTHTSKEQAVIIEHCRWSHLGNSRFRAIAERFDKFADLCPDPDELSDQLYQCLVNPTRTVG